MKNKLFMLPGILVLVQALNAQNLVPFNCGSDKWGYKNVNSNMVVVDCQFTYAGTLKNGYADIAANGKWGVIDSTGKIVIDPKYSSIWSIHKGTVIYEELSTGRRGITSVSGKVTLPPGKLSYIGAFTGGFSVIELQGKRGMIDYRGDLVVPLKYETIYPFAEGLARVKLDGKWGYVDPKGKVAIPLKYESAEAFSEGLAVVSAEGKKGYIDTKGKLMSQLQWESAGVFSEGMAPVKKDGLYGFINKKGDLVIPCKYEDLSGYGAGFNNGRAVVKLNGKYGCIDNTGKEIVPPVYDSFTPYSDSYALVTRDGKKQYIDVDGNVKINADYDEAYPFHNGMARVKKNNYFGLIGKDGAEVFPCQFSQLKDENDGFWYAEMYKSPLSIKGYIDTKGKPYFFSDEEIRKIDEERTALLKKMDFDTNDMAKYVCFGYKNFYLGYGDRKDSFKFGSEKELFKPSIQPTDTFRIRNLGQDRVYVEINLMGYNTVNSNERTTMMLKCPMLLKYGLVTDAGLQSSNPGLRAILLYPDVEEAAPEGLKTIKGCYLPWENRIYLLGYLQFKDGLRYFELTAVTDPLKPYTTVEKSIYQMLLDLYRPE